MDALYPLPAEKLSRNVAGRSAATVCHNKPLSCHHPVTRRWFNGSSPKALQSHPFNQEKIMKRSFKITLGLAAAVATGLAATVYAQAPYPGPGFHGAMGAMHGGPMFGDPSVRAEQHLTDLKGQLNITPAQETQWQAFADSVKKQGETMVAMHASMQSTASTVTERMDQRLAFMKLSLSNMEAVDTAAKQLYAVLTPEQKAAFDQAGAGFGPGRGFGPGHFGPGRFAPRQG
jgi:protein CpxP